MSMRTLLFSFHGRINRMPYWLVSLVMMIAVGAMIALILAGDSWQSAAPILVLLIPSIWIGIALTVKRLHDRNKSAWWVLVFYVLPGIMESIGNGADDAEIVLWFASTGLSIWGLVELGFLRGTIGPNAYGPDPLAGNLTLVTGTAGSKAREV